MSVIVTLTRSYQSHSARRLELLRGRQARVRGLVRPARGRRGRGRGRQARCRCGEEHSATWSSAATVDRERFATGRDGRRGRRQYTGRRGGGHDAAQSAQGPRVSLQQRHVSRSEMGGPVQVAVEIRMVSDKLRAGVHRERMMRRQTTGQRAHQLAPAPTPARHSSAGSAASTVR